jgi:hypothetical protein
MKRLLFILPILLFVGLIVGPVQAAYIDLRPDGVIMPFDGAPYDPGDNDVELEVWIMPDPGDVNLNGYAFDIQYDISETITYTGGNNTPPSGWITITAPADLVKDVPPYVQNIEGFDFFGTSPAPLAGGVQVATLDFVFDYPSGLVLDALADFSVYYRPGQGIILDDVAYEPGPGSVGPDLNAVPIPGAVLLLGSGLLGLVGIRRRKK